MTAMIAKETPARPHAEILEGRTAAETIKQEVAAAVATLKREHGATPQLAAVLVGEDPASAVYVRNKIRACVGIHAGVVVGSR